MNGGIYGIKHVSLNIIKKIKFAAAVKGMIKIIIFSLIMKKVARVSYALSMSNVVIPLAS